MAGPADLFRVNLPPFGEINNLDRIEHPLHNGYTSPFPVNHPRHQPRSLPLLPAALIAGHLASNKARRIGVHRQNARGLLVAQVPHTTW